MKFEFIKMHGCGNDFVIIDNRVNPVCLSKNEIIALANYKQSIGFDQLLVIEDSNIADAFMRIFNADGSEVNACGNGSRCVAKLLFDQLRVTQLNIATRERIIAAFVAPDEMISLNMGQAKIDQKIIDIASLSGMLVDVGNPHIVINVTDMQWDLQQQISSKVAEYGSLIENDPQFPNKINVNFVNIINSKLIILHTWERGAGATLSCGTGACASFYALYNQGLIDGNALIRQRGGDLHLSLDLQDIILTGEAKISYLGVY